MRSKGVPSIDLAGRNASQSPTAPALGLENCSNVTASLDSNSHPKPIKRRATKACTACRARKVRCDLMQQYHIMADGEITCSNCIMDGIKCAISNSKRQKKHLNAQSGAALVPTSAQEPAMSGAQSWQNGLVNPTDFVNQEDRRWSGSAVLSNDIVGASFSASQHVPHFICKKHARNLPQTDCKDQNVHQQINHGVIPQRQKHIPPQPFEVDPIYALLKSASIYGDRTATHLSLSPLLTPPSRFLKHALPGYLKPFPQQMTSADIDYLFAKGALSLPDIPVRNALFQSYLEYVHPYMPLIEVHEMIEIVEEGTGASGGISLLLFQAIMFAGTAFVDMDYLRSAGFSDRKVARKALFQKARVLYDFDYELDRVSLVQSLLLMTYWYETPDDQKDAWYWMGVAVSLAYTIGLHRNPDSSYIEPRKKKLCKRRPTRVKDEDYDVPMLTEDDFEIEPLPDHISIISRECTLARDVEMQRELAQMCIAKAKLCLCISHVLSAQYSVLVQCPGIQAQKGNTHSSVMLFPKDLDQSDEIRSCDLELSQWVNELPATSKYSNEFGVSNIAGPIFVHRALLNMAYFTTLSALHQPQVFHSAAIPTPERNRELQDTSQRKVYEASREITRIFQDLHARELEGYLLTTGVTVLPPAIVEALRWTPPLSNNHGVDHDLQEGHMMDISIPVVSEPSAPHNTISVRTPESENTVSHNSLPKTSMDFTVPPNGGDVDLDDFLTFDNGNEPWNVPLDEGAHGERDGFMRDMNWVDQALGWSRMMSPSPDNEAQDLFGCDGLKTLQGAVA
ncbi:hypothetical protein V500_07310 [Pseudogymnoascus sp. VKM F-4518 (FW-2643)]|nr:hypothetical protein V500_07310 [Pseudogymnoascus sp. VKM F-4518 (FW-2643)]